MRRLLHRWRKAESPAAVLRALLNVFYDSETCNRCGRRYLLWWCPDNELFARVTGREYHPPYVGGLYCPRCFDKLARKQGLVLEWNPRVFIDNAGREYLKVSEMRPEDMVNSP
jgi:hypothetical protein